MEFEWQQVSRTHLSILADLNNAVVWTVSTRSVISKSSCPSINLLLTVSRAPITISIIITFTFQSFFNSLSRSKYLSIFLHSFNFTLWSAGTAKSTIMQVIFFIDYYKVWSSVRDYVIRLNLKSQKDLCVSFSRTDSEFCIYYMFVWSNFIFLHNS